MSLRSFEGAKAFPDLGMGLGLRPDHYADVLKARSGLDWFEVVTENFMVEGGRALSILEQVRRESPVVLHGVSLSLGSTDPLNRAYLKSLKGLCERFEPAIVSDHLCWTGVDGINMHDLMPLPYTREVAEHVADRIARVQDFLGRRILVENVSSYLTYAHSEMTEWECLAEIARRADCGILLDVNNIYVSAVNHGFDPLEFLDAIPRERVGQIHLAGHSEDVNERGEKFLVDTHDAPVCEEVWSLYAAAIARFGAVSTMVEWDAKIPSFERVVAEVGRAKKILEKRLGAKTRRRGATAEGPSAVDALGHY